MSRNFIMIFLKRFILFLTFILFIASHSSTNGQCFKLSSSFNDLQVDKPDPGEWLADQNFDTTNTQEILNLVESGTLVESAYSSQFFC